MYSVEHSARYVLFLWRCGPTQVMGSSFLRFLDHTQRRTTVGRTPLDEWSVRRRDFYLTTHNNHNRQISMPPVGFEPTISVGERPQTYALGYSYIGARTDTTQQSGQTPDKEVEIKIITVHVSGYTETDTTGMLSPPTVWPFSVAVDINSNVFYFYYLIWALSRLLCCVGSGLLRPKTTRPMGTAVHVMYDIKILTNHVSKDSSPSNDTKTF